MRRFRRRGDTGSPAPRAPHPTGPSLRSSTVDEEADWRSYDRVAEAYARFHAPRTALVAADLVRVTSVGPGDRVLDVGAGTGVVARAAVEAGAGVVVGVDPSVPMLRQARRAGGGARYAAAEAIDLPFSDMTFDVVVSAFAVTHFKKYDTALFDMIRVLRGGRRFGVATWGPGDDEFSRAWSEVAESFAGMEILRDAYHRAMPWADRFSDPNRLKDALHESGIRQIRTERRAYRFDMTAEDYLTGRETTAQGRFLHQMLGDALWERFRERSRQVFAERFPVAFNDFRDVILAAGRKP